MTASHGSFDAGSPSWSAERKPPHLGRNDDVAGQLADLVGRFLQHGQLPASDDHVGSQLREEERDAAAQTSAAAGNEGRLPEEGARRQHRPPHRLEVLGLSR